MPLRAYPDYAYDRSGNPAGIVGVWLVPDEFDALTEYNDFTKEFAAKHPTKSGRLTERLRKTKARSWIRWMTARYERVKVVHHDE